MLASANEGSKSLHPVKKSEEPLYKIKSNGAFGGQVFLEDLTFKNFDDTTKAPCNDRQSIFERNPSAADYIPMHNFVRTTFDNVEDGAIAWIEEPNPGWATTSPLTSPDNCGDYPCTGPDNVVLSFKDTTENTDLAISANAAFQITSRNSDVVRDLNCVERTDWESYRCESPDLGVLIFESLDADNEDREL